MEFDKKYIELVRRTFPNATEPELYTLIYLAKEYNLDPIKKEIYFIKYGSGKPTIITGRDGYLKIANTNPQFDGLESDVVYEGDKLTKREDGSLLIEYGENHMVFNTPKLIGAFANVFRKDRTQACSVFISLKDYQKRDSTTWKQYINAMTLKVAETMALKRAFAISGLVTKEELDAGSEE